MKRRPSTLSATSRFLVVDDFATMRHFIRNQLKDLGYPNADDAENGLTALRKLRERQYDFVITDWNMPRMDGLALLTEIRRSTDLLHLPVLMITAEAKRENIIAAAHAGADGYIVKPFPPSLLAEKIAKIMSKMVMAA